MPPAELPAQYANRFVPPRTTASASLTPLPCLGLAHRFLDILGRRSVCNMLRCGGPRTGYVPHRSGPGAQHGLQWREGEACRHERHYVPGAKHASTARGCPVLLSKSSSVLKQPVFEPRFQKLLNLVVLAFVKALLGYRAFGRAALCRGPRPCAPFHPADTAWRLERALSPTRRSLASWLHWLTWPWRCPYCARPLLSHVGPSV